MASVTMIFVWIILFHQKSPGTKSNYLLVWEFDHSEALGN